MGHWLTAVLRPLFSVRASCRAILPRIRTSVNQAFRGGGPGACRAEPSCVGPTSYPIGRLLRLPTKRGVDATGCWGHCVVASERDQCGAGYVAIRQHDQHLLVQTVSTTQRDQLRSAQQAISRPDRILRVWLSAIGVQRVSGEDRHAEQRENSRGSLDHCRTSSWLSATRYLLREWFQIRSMMNCMFAVPFYRQQGWGSFVSTSLRGAAETMSSAIVSAGVAWRPQTPQKLQSTAPRPRSCRCRRTKTAQIRFGRPMVRSF